MFDCIAAAMALLTGLIFYQVYRGVQFYEQNEVKRAGEAFASAIIIAAALVLFFLGTKM